MRHPRISRSQFLQILMFLSFVLFAGPSSGLAKDPPSDLCTLLPPTQLRKVLGLAYGTPENSTAPRPYAANPTGTQCQYSVEKDKSKSVIFIVYVDPSTAVAKETFSKLSVFFAPNTPVAGIGDTAYLDAKHAIHVVTGKVRYYINIPIGTYTPEIEKQLKDLATGVAGQL